MHHIAIWYYMLFVMLGIHLSKQMFPELQQEYSNLK